MGGSGGEAVKSRWKRGGLSKRTEVWVEGKREIQLTKEVFCSIELTCLVDIFNRCAKMKE